MAKEWNVDLWGEKSIIETNKCAIRDCDNPRDNAGNGNYHSLCASHHKAKYKMADWEYKIYRKEYCENIDGRLGFKCTATIIMDAQLTVDHKDGDNERHHPTNLQTLCFNCHAVKTKINGDNISKKYRPSEEQIKLRWESFWESLK
jgi:5-methylcytosine-specific restriction endonuclease McrA